MPDLDLTLACWNYDRTAALFDGRIKPENLTLDMWSTRQVGEIMERMVQHRQFDVSELGITYYIRSLELLDRARHHTGGAATKTGIMVGLGEREDEIVAVFDDLRRVGVSILTIGQYLRPSPAHAPMERYYHPDEFAEMKAEALAMGFRHVESGPLVRSSYHARDQVPAGSPALRGRRAATATA